MDLIISSTHPKTSPPPFFAVLYTLCLKPTYLEFSMFYTLKLIM